MLLLVDSERCSVKGMCRCEASGGSGELEMNSGMRAGDGPLLTTAQDSLVAHDAPEEAQNLGRRRARRHGRRPQTMAQWDRAGQTGQRGGRRGSHGMASTPARHHRPGWRARPINIGHLLRPLRRGPRRSWRSAPRTISSLRGPCYAHVVPDARPAGSPPELSPYAGT